jgi:hypothetical protein
MREKEVFYELNTPTIAKKIKECGDDLGDRPEAKPATKSKVTKVPPKMDLKNDRKWAKKRRTKIINKFALDRNICLTLLHHHHHQHKHAAK